MYQLYFSLEMFWGFEIRAILPALKIILKASCQQISAKNNPLTQFVRIVLVD